MTTRSTALCLSTVLMLAGGADAQTARTGRLMREKLMHAQRLLGALATSDYTVLQRETLALTRVTQSPAWNELMTPELRPYTGDFTKALAALAAASDRRDADSAAASYNAMVTACLSCHKHVMGARIARAP